MTKNLIIVFDISLKLLFSLSHQFLFHEASQIHDDKRHYHVTLLSCYYLKRYYIAINKLFQ